MDEDDEVPQPTVITVPGKTVPRKRKAESGTGEDADRAKKPKIKEEPINGGREVIIRVLHQPDAVHLGYKVSHIEIVLEISALFRVDRDRKFRFKRYIDINIIHNFSAIHAV